MNPALFAAASSRSGSKRVVRRLRREGATSAWSARPFEPTSRLERRALERALHAGLVHRTDEGTYWVDEERVARLRTCELRWVLVSLLAMVLLFGILTILGEFP